MLRVGLTGGVGSGKSSVADLLAELGARVSRSDETGRAMMQPGEPVMEAIVAHFGASVTTGTGELDRAKLAQIAFAEGRVEELNALVHPAVIAAQRRWMDAVADEDPQAVAVIESALILETKHGDGAAIEGAAAGSTAPWRTRFDCIVLVTAPVALRRVRYIERVRGLDWRVDSDTAAKDFDLRAKTQFSDEQKSALADRVVLNDGSKDDLRARVGALYAVLKQDAIDRAAEAM